MNVSSTYESHIDGFSDVEPNSISSKYFMYTLANTGNHRDPITSPSCAYMSDAIPKYAVSTCGYNNKDEDNTPNTLEDRYH